jgi:hypothetical protein
LVRRPLKWSPQPSHKVCSSHFKGGRKTADELYPTIFPNRTKLATSQISRKSRATADRSLDQTPAKTDDHRQLYQPLSLKEAAKKCYDDAQVLLQQTYKEEISALHGIISEKEEKKDLETAVNRRTLFLENVLSTNDLGLFRYYTGIEDYHTCILYEELFARAAEHMMYIGTQYCKVAQSSGIPVDKRKGRNSVLSKRNEYFLVLCRLRLGYDEVDLGERFGVSQETVSRIWRSRIILMSERLRQLPIWPTTATVQQEMPQAFKDLYSQTKVILDCTEIFLEGLTSQRVQSETFSVYKHHNTAKGLIGVTPHGSVSFISHLYGGEGRETSDKAIVKNCGILDLLQEGDAVMADHGLT